MPCIVAACASPGAPARREQSRKKTRLDLVPRRLASPRLVSSRPLPTSASQLSHALLLDFDGRTELCSPDTAVQYGNVLFRPQKKNLVPQTVAGKIVLWCAQTSVFLLLLVLDPCPWVVFCRAVAQGASVPETRRGPRGQGDAARVISGEHNVLLWTTWTRLCC